MMELIKNIATWFGDLVDRVLSWLITFVGIIIGFIVDLLAGMAELFLSWLPDADSALSNHSQVNSLWAQFLNANQYVPLDLAATLTGIWAGVFVALSIYKLWKSLPLT